VSHIARFYKGVKKNLAKFNRIKNYRYSNIIGLNDFFRIDYVLSRILLF